MPAGIWPEVVSPSFTPCAGCGRDLSQGSRLAYRLEPEVCLVCGACYEAWVVGPDLRFVAEVVNPRILRPVAVVA